ncbi:MAG: polysaccharide biosynthesis protein PslH [Solirubrobacteraceae bacterium]|nr:polysaccharide biosynthesis protein PslH [Solirubrobacteraceae bacterium]
MSDARVIFAARRPPWPLDNGARIRAFRLCEALSRRFDVTLVTFGDGPAYDTTRASRADLEAALGVPVELVPYGRRPPGGARRNVLRRASDTFGHYATPTLRAALRRLVAEHPGALLHLDDPGVALAALGLPAAVSVAATHNVEHRIMRDIARRMPAAHRPFMELEWRKIAAEERRVWRAADLCLAVSEIDAETMRATGAERVEVCPNGSDPHDPLPPRPLRPGEPLRLVFVAALRFWPYAYALAWFIREALPAVRAAAGPVTIDVVGEHDEDVLHADGVTYHGRVPDVEPFYDGAHALALPVFEGSGTRLKVVEAAQYGRPIVSTALGVQGLLDRPGEQYLRAETAADFAAALAELRADLEAGGAATAARCEAARAATGRLVWPRIGAELAELYDSCLTFRSEARRRMPIEGLDERH